MVKENKKDGKNASLFDDALSGRVKKRKKTKYVWPVIFILGGIGMTYSIFYGAGEQKEELIAELEEQAQEDAVALEKRLAEMRSRIDEQEGSDTTEGESLPDISANTEKAPQKVPVT